MVDLKLVMKRLLVSFALLLSIALPVTLLTPQLAFADAKSEVCSGIGSVPDGSGACSDQNSGTINNVLKAVVNILSVVAVIMIIIAGYKYITSNGESGQIASAKTTLVYAIVGILIVAFSQVIVQFVLDRVT